MAITQGKHIDWCQGLDAENLVKTKKVLEKELSVAETVELTGISLSSVKCYLKPQAALPPPDGLGALLSVDGAVFAAYFDQVLGPTFVPGDVVVLDNLSVHKVVGLD